ncbi:hypothetical protein GGI04_001179 [Coemansia thaxteri]|nr:hypothetical protein GGI04_001179 [Coemansia thaxteri]KAJ2481766.1 hypothetical protein EV174_003386 [Coemansia sp. RSA 2320]
MYSPLGFIKNSYNPVRSKVVIGCTIILAVVSFSGVYLVARSGSRADTSGLSTIVDDNFNYIDLPDVVDAKPVNGRLPGVKNLFSLESTIPVKDRITTTSFMFRGDFSSPIHDLFVLHKRALKICDKDTKADGCDIKLANNYTWFTLGAKLLDTLEILCKVDDDKKTDFYIKYDDDLLMSETKLEEIIRKMASTRCQFAGGIALDFPYYWAVGQIYIFKSNTDAIVFAPDTGANADPGIVTILGDSDDDNYSCTITVDVTVTGSTLPYCDESSLWLSDIGDLDSDSGIDSSSATTSSKKSACPPSHFMAGLYTAAFAAALAVANVALF